MRPSRDPPFKCDACHSLKVIYTTEHQALGTSNRLWPYIYSCQDCHAVVGCHPGTNNPLGFMANAKTRLLRRDLHRIIDPLWESGLATRTEVYAWIAKELHVEFSFCHISQLSGSQLVVAIEFAQKYAVLNAKRVRKQLNDREKAKSYQPAAIRRRRF